jgi:hypothetical protein
MIQTTKGNKTEIIITPENIDLSYRDYYKNYKDGIDESTLDRFRYHLNKRNLERQKEKEDQNNLTSGRGRTIKYTTPYNEFQDSSLEDPAPPMRQQQEANTGHVQENGMVIKANKVNYDRIDAKHTLNLKLHGI